MLTTPSFLAHMLGSIFLILFVVIWLSHWNTLRKDPYKYAMLAGMASLIYTIHGLSHLGLEKVYGYNPLDWFK